MKYYNLNLTNNYCTHWTKEHALRELIANTIDECGHIEVDEDNNTLLLSNERSLPFEAFLIGYSNKATCEKYTIGQYGEGLKLAALICTRLGHKITITTRNVQYDFMFRKAAGFKEQTLHVKITEIEYLTAGTWITVSNVTRADVNKIYITTPTNSVLEHQKGLYCQGLLVDPTFYLLDNESKIYYGVNLDCKIQMNRDRTYFADTAKIMPILENYFNPAFFLDFETNLFVSTIFKGFSRDYCQRILKAYYVKRHDCTLQSLEGKTMLVVSSTLGYKIDPNVVLVKADSWFYGNYLMRTPDETLLTSLELPTTEELEVYTKSSVQDERLKNILSDANNATSASQLILALVNYIPLTPIRKETLVKHLMEIGQVINKVREI